MVGNFFDASVLFEAGITVNGWYFLTIYGRHANGYFIAIPNWGICCEATEPSDTFYNAEKLMCTKPNNGEKITKAMAQELAQKIKTTMKQRKNAEVSV